VSVKVVRRPDMRVPEPVPEDVRVRKVCHQRRVAVPQARHVHHGPPARLRVERVLEDPPPGVAPDLLPEVHDGAVDVFLAHSQGFAAPASCAHYELEQRAERGAVERGKEQVRLFGVEVRRCRRPESRPFNQRSRIVAGELSLNGAAERRRQDGNPSLDVSHVEVSLGAPVEPFQQVPSRGLAQTIPASPSAGA
jgi:hypothetical protein